jgi:hypothetical protein
MKIVLNLEFQNTFIIFMEEFNRNYSFVKIVLRFSFSKE